MLRVALCTKPFSSPAALYVKGFIGSPQVVDLGMLQVRLLESSLSCKGFPVT